MTQCAGEIAFHRRAQLLTHCAAAVPPLVIKQEGPESDNVAWAQYKQAPPPNKTETKART